MGEEGSIGACGHRGLVHVQGAGKARLQRFPLEVAVLKPVVVVVVGGRMDRRFVAADRWIEVLHVRG